MGLTTWLNNARLAVYNWANKLAKLFSPEDEPLLVFFSPLIKQVKEEALRLGKNNLQVGLNILKDAAMTAATAAATAPSGMKTQAAEDIFIQILKSKGVTAIHNAQAGLIKAAVAIIQGQITSSTQTPPE